MRRAWLPFRTWRGHPDVEHPIVLPAAIQPALIGLESRPETAPETAHRPAATAAPAGPGAAGVGRAKSVAPRLKGRRRYWSIRDLSRRLWFGRGYELLRELIRANILPATRSARSWWVDDADVLSLLQSFDATAGKVRAFRGLDAWLQERCWVVPATAEAEALLHALRAGFVWRGNAYLPKTAWQAELSAGGQPTYHHRSGVALPAGALLAA